MADPLAIYGAVVGTFAAIGVAWTIYHGWWLDRPRLHVDATLRSNILHLNAVNSGRRPVTVARMGICYTNGEEITTVADLPEELKEGQMLERTLRFVAPEGDAAPSGSPCHSFALSATGRRVRTRLPDDMAKYIRGKAHRQVEIHFV